jgi:acyl-CoA synthetase (AMP-forming)/AMP-acid ligase II/aryl carrier-like protein
MRSNATLIKMIRDQASRNPAAVALLAPGRLPLAYQSLVDHLDASAACLAATGVKRGERVALVLPDGPEMAVAFLAVASLATCAPLNPAYSSREFEFYLSDLKAKLLIVREGSESPAVAVARSLGIRVIMLRPQPDAPTGVFSLPGAVPGRAPARAVRPDDPALLLHTSGTTSRPKLVPLTQANLAASARNIAAWLDLTPQDRCLNIMPLFHVHGLIGAVVASLVAGASVICTPGLDPDRVLGWMAELSPTWYTAVPTMHQAILEAAGREAGLAGRVNLRFIRSCSSALSPQVGRKLEEIFRAPVIEAYGMTEASHQIACNPLPPRPHKFGSVGLPAGDEVAILDEHGKPQPPNAPGEISIRGVNVMRGYEKNPAANVASFSNGWLRTGDRGYRDEEGYIFIQARLKEMINRGGEKISPREIDEALLQHPGVLQAVAFSLPHPTLGEDVAAAVVLRPGQAPTAGELRRFVASRLADFKVPRKIVFLSEIPKGPTGKVQRIGLAEKLKPELEALAAGSTAQRQPPLTATEQRLVALWQEVLNIGEVGIHDDFFLLGGDSLRGAQLLTRLRELSLADLTLSDLLNHPTVFEMASLVEKEPRTL